MELFPESWFLKLIVEKYAVQRKVISIKCGEDDWRWEVEDREGIIYYETMGGSLKVAENSRFEFGVGIVFGYERFS